MAYKPKLNLDDIYCVSSLRQCIPVREIRSLEKKQGIAFPQDYIDYMRKFGVGTYCDFLMLHPPNHILKELHSKREMLVQGITDGYWNCGPLHVSEEEAAAMVPFADTIDGDMFALAPSGWITMFPRHESQLHRTGKSLVELFYFLAENCKLTGAWFQPRCDSARIRLVPEEHTTPPSVDKMGYYFSKVGKATYLVRNETCVDHFIKRFGAHLQYLHLHDQRYVQFIVTCNRSAADQFFSRLENAIADEAFRVTEQHGVPRSVVWQ